MEKRQKRKRYAQFHLWIDPDILSQLRALARKEGRTTAEIMREAAAKILREREAMADLLKKRGGYKVKEPPLPERRKIHK